MGEVEKSPPFRLADRSAGVPPAEDAGKMPTLPSKHLTHCYEAELVNEKKRACDALR